MRVSRQTVCSVAGHSRVEKRKRNQPTDTTDGIPRGAIYVVLTERLLGDLYVKWDGRVRYHAKNECNV